MRQLYDPKEKLAIRQHVAALSPEDRDQLLCFFWEAMKSCRWTPQNDAKPANGETIVSQSEKYVAAAKELLKSRGVDTGTYPR